MSVCSAGWHEGNNEYAPFVKYLLSIILGAYREFEERVDYLVPAQNQSGKTPTGAISKTGRVHLSVEKKLGGFTKRELLQQVPDIGESTVELVLAEMLKEGPLIKIGNGRGTSYVYEQIAWSE